MFPGLQTCQCNAFKGCHWKESFWSLTLHALASERWSGLSSSLFTRLSFFLSLFLVQLVYPYQVPQETNERFCVSRRPELWYSWPNVPLHEHHVASVVLRVHDGCQRAHPRVLLPARVSGQQRRWRSHYWFLDLFF